jgi:CDP-glucose 4,6-dehydratase
MAFWRGRRVLVTGHTGFKGSWLAVTLAALGAEVTGAALPPEDGPALFPLVAPPGLDHRIVDIGEPAAVAALLRDCRPSVVLHLAAQALVPRGIADPAGTFAANLGGTVHLLQAMRGLPGIDAALIVTTDKVYRNDGDGRRFTEDDPLGGADPYSASKAAAELAVASWRRSYGDDLPPLATARAGNVLGGGDFAPTRLVPDLVRAWDDGTTLLLRHPDATRPWQHVLDVLRGYLLQAEALAAGTSPPALNFGPPADGDTPVRALIAAFAAAFGSDLPWRQVPAPPEAACLALDATRAAATLGWQPRFDRAAGIAATASWYAAWRRGEDMRARTRRDVAEALA